MTRSAMPIYLDYQSTTPTDPRVVDAMVPYFYERFGNPHSRSHAYGWEAEEACEIAREHVADLIGANPKEIVFTSGATESNNMSVKGVARFYKAKKNHIITVATEHKCVLDSCRHLEQEGFEVTYLSVDEDGYVRVSDIEAAIKDTTVLVSVMAVNNEIGVVQPLKEIGALCREKGVFFHTDAAQAFGKIPLDVNEMNIDLMSISGHKIYGPKGVGALFVRRRPRVRLEPLISGGGQERGFRSGTLSTPLVVGLGKAAEIAKQDMQKDHDHIMALRKRLFDGIVGEIAEVHINGCKEREPSIAQAIAGNVNISFAYIEGESMLMAIRELAVSSGSACTSASLEPSYVLKALGVGEDLAHTSIRFGIGRFTTKEEIDKAIEIVRNNVDRLRELSPLWDMAQDGIDINSIQWAHH